jgi:hypothetical protein
MPSRFVAAVIVLLSTLALFGACNGQGEGDVCDKRNGDNDCRNGYTCQIHAGVQGARCCPGNPAAVTTVACGLNQGVGTDASSAAPPADAGDEDATTPAVEDGASDGDATMAADAVEEAIDGADDGG